MLVNVFIELLLHCLIIIKNVLIKHLAQHRFDREFGRRLEEAFDEVVFKSIKIYNASPLRLIAPVFESFERYFIIQSGFTDHAEPICNVA